MAGAPPDSVRAELGLCRLLGHLERNDELRVVRWRVHAGLPCVVLSRTELVVWQVARGSVLGGPLAAASPGEAELGSDRVLPPIGNAAAAKTVHASVIIGNHCVQGAIHICTHLASSSPDSGELMSTDILRRPSGSVSSMTSVLTPRRLRTDASCCSWRSALCSGESQPSPACSLLERRSLGPTEPMEPPSSGGELDGFRHLCTQRINGEGVSAAAIRHARLWFAL